MFKINKYLQDDILNCEHPSDFEVHDDYAVLILRLPYIKNDHVLTASYAFLIKEKIYRYSRRKNDFVELGDFNDLHNYLDVRIDKILAKLSKLQVQIDRMEDRLYDEDIDRSFAKEWLSLKKDLAIIERLMQHSIIAFGRFVKRYKSKIDELAYKDLEEHIERAYRYAKAAIEKLDYLFNFYKLRVDERMNKIMFILTILSGIFLPLTLVTGYFGMNTGGLPLTEDPHGTLKVTVGLLLFEVPFIVWIWRMIKEK